jgi:hypothetical protein
MPGVLLTLKPTIILIIPGNDLMLNALMRNRFDFASQYQRGQC